MKRGRVSTYWRAAALALVLAGSLTACSKPDDTILVHLADGYYVTFLDCAQQAFVRVDVANVVGDDDDTMSQEWSAVTMDGTPQRLPAEGLRIAAQEAEWVAPPPDFLDLSSAVQIRVERLKAGESRGNATGFSLDIPVGQYRTPSGDLGDWQQLLDEQPCR